MKAKFLLLFLFSAPRTTHADNGSRHFAPMEKLTLTEGTSVTGGIIMIIPHALIGIVTVGIGLIVAPIVPIVWAIVAVNRHNASLTINIQIK